MIQGGRRPDGLSASEGRGSFETMRFLMSMQVRVNILLLKIRPKIAQGGEDRNIVRREDADEVGDGWNNVMRLSFSQSVKSSLSTYFVDVDVCLARVGEAWDAPSSQNPWYKRGCTLFCPSLTFPSSLFFFFSEQVWVKESEPGINSGQLLASSGIHTGDGRGQKGATQSRDGRSRVALAKRLPCKDAGLH